MTLRERCSIGEAASPHPSVACCVSSPVSPSTLAPSCRERRLTERDRTSEDTCVSVLMNSYTYSTDPRVNQTPSQNQTYTTLQGLYPSTYQTTTYTTSTSAPNGYNNSSFIPNNGTIVQQGRVQQSLRLAQGEQEEKRLNNVMESYYIEPSTSNNWQGQPSHGVQSSQGIQIGSQMPYQNGQLISTSPAKGLPVGGSQKLMSTISPDKAEKERQKKARQAEAARQRYHRLTPQQKRELNLKRTLAQKRKRQREKEMEELDSILRETNDIQEDPDITEQLREKRMRAKWAEAARQRYARMTPDERRAHNNRRRQRQMQNALKAVKAAGGTGDPVKDEEAVRQHIKMQNAKKAEAARMRYHRMTDDEKRLYNQRRTEAFRRRRMEEEMLLAMPIGRINGEALDRAQQIVVRNAKRAEAARARYQRMTPDQRKNYNQKRYTPKRRSANGEMGGPMSSKKEDLDVLSTLEREVMKRTQQAQQALKRQQGAAAAAAQQQQHNQSASSSNPPPGTYIIQPNQQTVTHIPQQGVQIQLAPNGSHQQVVHVSHHMQPIQTQGHTIITQQQGFNQPLPTSQSHVVVHNSAPTSGGHLVVAHHPQAHQVTYTTNGNMMITNHVPQPVQQQVINPYQQRNQWMNVFLADDRPGGSESPHLENLTTNSGSFPSLASYPATTTYYTTPATYFSNDIPTHHGLQPVRLPSIASSLSGVSDLGTIKEHPAAGQVDQMNSYMEYFVEGDSQVVHDGTVAEEVVVDDVVHYESQHGIEDNLMEDTLVEDQGLPTVSYAHMSDDSSSPMIYRKKQHKPLDMMRNGMSPEEDVGKNEVVRQKRAEAARTRYQRMSEQERKVYNQKRRLKALGIDPNSNDPHITEQIKETIKRANAKKAEAARQRYHNMTPDEKREYNQRRTQSFRRRREEEEILLSTPAGAISADALQKAQQIMIRNARKAESARARYQKMTPDQRKEYNIRRAACKKSRNKMLREASISGSDVNNESMSDPASISLNSSFTEPPPMLEPPPPEIEQQSYILPPKPKDPRDEILLQMEKEVLKRTNRAKQILDKQQKTSQEPPSREQRYPDMHHEQMIMNDTPDRPYTSQNQLMIDEKALHDMLVTGRDANGMAVELRTVDGIKITDESQLREVAQGQTIVIQPCEPGIIIESKDNMYVQTPEGQLLLTQGTSSQGYGQYRTGYSSGIEDPSMMSLAERHAAAKAKRAERARIRYRNMQPELRQAQNAKRADLLRKSRARDEELVQMAESRDVGTLTPDVQRAIQDAKERRRKRAEQARSKYHRMSSEERRQYNAMRDAQRRQRKRVQEMEKGTLDHDDRSNINHHRNGPSDSMTPPEQLEERIIYNGFEMYDDNWDQ